MNEANGSKSGAESGRSAEEFRWHVEIVDVGTFGMGVDRIGFEGRQWADGAFICLSQFDLRNEVAEEGHW